MNVNTALITCYKCLIMARLRIEERHRRPISEAMDAMRLDDFDFDLPRGLIADHPCEPREAARLLIIPASAGFQDRRIADLPELLRPGDLLVFNDTKVIPARLEGRRGEATIEITLYRDLGGGAWRTFAKGARRLRLGDTV